MAKFSRIIIISLSLVLISQFTYSQFLTKFFSSETDTNYIEDFSSEITSRIFGSTKSASFRLVDQDIKKTLDYLPNENLMMGVGANHGFLGINIGINFPFLNKDDDKYGTTNYINFTTRVLTRKMSIDIILQAYQGYYLANSQEMIRDWTDPDSYLIRSDLRTNSYGISAQYIFNNKRFSYRAGFLQNEWQKKSAGSLIAGSEVYYHIMKGDSSMVPRNLKTNHFFNDYHPRQISIFSIGPTIGYAHTFVLLQHWFLSLSLTMNLAMGYSHLYPENPDMEVSKSGLTLNFNTVPKIAFGYNSRRWCFDISYNNLSERNQAPFDEGWIHFDTGNFRFNIVYRFHIKKPLKILNPGLLQEILPGK